MDPLWPWGSHALEDPFRFKEMKDVRVSFVHRLICPNVEALWIRMEIIILLSLFFARELNLCKKKKHSFPSTIAHECIQIFPLFACRVFFHALSFMCAKL